MTAQRADRAALAALTIVLGVAYAPVLHATYYMRDEFLMVQDTPPSLAQVGFVATVLGWKNARPLAYPFYGVYAAIDARGGLPWIRLSQIAMAIGAAALFYRLLRRRAVMPAAAFGLVLFLWSQPAFTIYAAYCPMAPYWLGVCSAWGAWVALHDRGPAPPSRRRRVVAALGLAVGWLTFQAAPFGIFVLAGFDALTTRAADWGRARRTHVTAFVLFGCTAIAYIVATKAMLAVGGVHLTSPVQRAFALLSGGDPADYRRLLDPITLLGPFEWWNYAWPAAALSDQRFLLFAGASAALWIVTVLVAFAIEYAAGPRRTVAERYGVALTGVACTYLPVALEGIKELERQHVAIALVPALVLTFVYAAGIILRACPALRPAAIGLATLTVVVACAGARANLARGVVGLHAGAHAFAVEAVRQHGGPDTASILVIGAQETPCTVEPCRGLYGRTAWAVTRTGFPKLYRRLAQEHLGRSGLPVTYLPDGATAPPAAPDTLVVDYRRFQQRPSDPVP